MKRLTGSAKEISKILDAEYAAYAKSQDNFDEIVATIIANVRNNGDTALRAYSEEFDGVAISEFEVSRETIQQAFDAIDPDVLLALQNAKENIQSYHKHQVETGFVDAQASGVIRGQLVLPIEKVGVYVPGGTAAYPSSVLMNVLPAKIAGVPEIYMVTPPQTQFNPAILVAAQLAGVTKIFQVGGAQAIAALAYGTESIPKVDKITGPGNVFVATAKKQVFGQVGIDMIAGPSEIGVIADSSANAAYVAADLLSQAEHDKLARAVLVTDSIELADAVDLELEKQLQTLPRETIARASIENNGRTIIANSVDEMFDLMNEVAPEHLEIALDDAMTYLPKIKHAGSIFLGHFTSEPIGDYYAGTNHVLPTSGTARFYSALGVYDFVKRSQFTYYSQDAVVAATKDITTLAYSEGLQAHARAIEIRGEIDK
ncbi:histidinol dehydrogenase [Lactococcus chungangensis]|nr:histidinol dehydrogenase [Lactococcus chungangensis]MDD3015808.1 histidinol dehydrogenase [Lactococcus chungangensis]NCB81660.1 histidinol dehydrogenase [Bacilli bacterium]NLH36414.1 histidinol dehydrogenase [Lactococcus chungangensis]PCS01923.1 histidinol dehydrogenase [Lactococcus chungangensis CAU 28 = DSM 22330]